MRTCCRTLATRARHAADRAGNVRALAIPPTRLDWDILRSHLASAQNHQDRDHDEGYAPPHSGLAHDATAFFFSGRCLRTTILQFAAEPA